MRIKGPSYLKCGDRLDSVVRLLPDNLPWKPVSVALLLLQGDRELLLMLEEEMEQRDYLRLEGVLNSIWSQGDDCLTAISRDRARWAQRLSEMVTISFQEQEPGREGLLDRLTVNPLTGLLILLLVLYLGLYRLVGVLIAGQVVDLLEGQLFGRYLNPLVEGLVVTYLPWPALQDLLVGPYGVFTLGLRYALAIVLPLVGGFFLFFSLLEDSGYLPRVSMLLDRICRKVGLNGQAVIPLVLGFGCATMATLTTRILETERERIIATFLLALSIHCSAQLGVLLVLLAAEPAALMIWALVVGLVFLVSGSLCARILPGRGPYFLMEVPHLRWPRPGNIIIKTLSRMKWYLIEVLPLFIYASLLIWLGRITGLFQRLLNLMIPLMELLGLPGEAAVAFFFGFFRRDYGAAGLFDLHRQGALEGASLLVAAVTLTLFVPCIAQLAVNIKERGLRVALAITSLILPLAFLIGYLLHLIVKAFNIL